MPARLHLILVSHLQQALLAKIIADELESYGQIAHWTSRHRKPGQAREIHAGGVEIREVHGERVVGILAETECR